ncbi:MAG: PAS domain S-box protein [bacterium]|nr:PAS domain S-box protein [bacterium]
MASWLAFDRYEAQEIRSKTNLTAEQVARRMESSLRQVLAGLQAVKQDFELRYILVPEGSDKPDGPTVFSSRTIQRVAETATESITWVTPDHRIAWTSAQGKDQLALEATLADPAVRQVLAGTEGGEPVLSPPLGDERRIAAVMKIIEGGRHLGFLLATIEPGRFVESNLTEATTRRFDYFVSDGADPVYPLEPSTGLASSPYGTSREIECGQRKWNIAIAPTAAFAAQSRTDVDEWILVGILLFSIAQAWLTRGLLRAQGETRQSRERYRRIVEDLPDMVCRFRPEAEITFVNEAYARYFGSDADDLVGSSFLSVVPEDERNRVMGHFASLTTEKPSAIVEHRVKMPDGEQRWQRWHDRALIDSTGGIIEVQSIGRDVTEEHLAETALREARQHLDHILPRSHTILYSRDPKGDNSTMYVSPNVELLLGYSVEEILTDPNFWTTHADPEDAELIWQCNQTALSSGRAIGEYRIRHKDGHYVWLRDELIFDSDADGPRFEMVGTMIDITASKLAAEHERLMANELNHRVKNTLASIVSLLEQTAITATSTADLVRSFGGRVAAMARVHEALAGQGWQHVDIFQIVHSTLEPYSSTGGDRITLHGKPLLMPARTASPLGLVLHELSTNAAKYGVLSTLSGSILIQWSIDEDGEFLLSWRETGGPAVVPPAANGFGLRLIRGLIEHELGGQVDLEFQPGGLSCTIQLTREPDYTMHPFSGPAMNSSEVSLPQREGSQV